VIAVLAYIVMALSGAMVVWGLVTAALDKPPGRAQLLFAAGVEGADGVGEVFADVGREHCAHAEFFGGEVAGEAADVKGCDDCRNWISTVFERAVGLREKSGDQAG